MDGKREGTWERAREEKREREGRERVAEGGGDKIEKEEGGREEE